MASGGGGDKRGRTTRYLLACRGLPNIKGQGARPVFERTFREFGLPRAIRTDNGVPFACRPGRAATRVQSLSDAVQRRAAARLSRRPDAQLALHRLAPRLSRATASARISGALPGQACHQRRHVPAQAQAALHCQRAQTTSHWPRRNRPRDLGDLLRNRALGESRRARDDHSRLTRCSPLT